MLIPTKHTNFSESIIGYGSYILSQLDRPKSVDALWKKYQIDYKNERYYSKHNFDNHILTIIFLYSINAIEDENGVIKKCV